LADAADPAAVTGATLASATNPDQIGPVTAHALAGAAMFIETEGTPNPATLKFLPGRDVMGSLGTADFASPDAVARSPLAARLFALDGVARVFLGQDFVTVTLTGAADWQTMRPQVLGAIMEHFVAGLPVLEGAAEDGLEDFNPADAEIVVQIKELLETRVRPAVASDGGDIVFRGFREGIVKLQLQGSCSGCPSSSATLKHGVENMLRHYVPEVLAVEQVDA
jgi:Fe-S cluster biogenesis protein NfuA